VGVVDRILLPPRSARIPEKARRELAAPGFTQLAWKTLAKGTSAYLTSLAAHHTEVTEYVLAGGYAVQGKSHQRNGEQYLREITELLDEAKSLPIADSATPRQATFVRGRCPR